MTNAIYLDNSFLDTIDVFKGTEIIMGSNSATVDVRMDKPVLVDFILSNTGSSVDIETVTISEKVVQLAPSIFFDTDDSIANTTVISLDTGGDRIEYDKAADTFGIRINGGPTCELIQGSATSLQVLEGVDTISAVPLLLGETIATQIEAHKDLHVDTINELTGAAGITFGNEIFLPTTTGVPSALDYYGIGTFSLEWNGPWAVNPTNNSNTFVRIGDQVTIWIERELSAGAVSISATSTVIPADIRPEFINWQACVVIFDNSGFQQFSGMIQIATTGVLTILRDGINTPWTNTGDNGWEGFSITYKV